MIGKLIEIWKKKFQPLQNEVDGETKAKFIEHKRNSVNHGPDFEVMKQGELRKHIIMVGGKNQKKGMRKWRTTYAVLTENLFMTYRNAKDFMSHNTPDELFDAKQAKIRWSDLERSKKDNVFEVYDEKTLILFYHEEFNEANLWMRNFKDIENKHKEHHTFTKKDLEKEDKESKVEGLNRFFNRW